MPLPPETSDHADPSRPDATAHPGATRDVAVAQPDYGCCGTPTLPAGAMLAGTGTLQRPQLIEDMGVVSERGETGGRSVRRTAMATGTP